MSYFDNEEEYRELGIDYDLVACLEYNGQKDFSISDIKKVLAVHEGERDEEDWHWVIKLKSPNKYVYLRGGCDYTGWDCQSWASSYIDTTPLKALYVLKTGHLPIDKENNPINAGFGHMLTLLSGTYNNKDQEIYEELKQQIKQCKNKTWREINNNEMPNLPKING